MTNPSSAMNEPVSTRRGTLCGFVAIFLWSTVIALSRSLSEQVGPLTAGAAVYTAGGLGFVAVLAFRRRGLVRSLAELPRLYLVGCGTLFALYTAVLFLALGLAANDEQALAVGLINYLWPALTILLSVPLGFRKAHRLLIPGTLLALAGVFLALTSGQSASWAALDAVAENPLAFGLGLVAALAWALYSNLARRWGGPAAEGGVPVFVLASGLVLLLVRLFWPEPGIWNVRALIEAAGMALIVTVSYECWDTAMRRGNMALVTTCSYLIPLLSTLVSCVYLGVLPGVALWIGCLCIIGGTFLTFFPISDERRRP